MKPSSKFVAAWLLFTAVSTTMVAGCDDESDTVERAQLSRSRKSWEQIKARPTTHYRYTSHVTSFTGSAADTTIEVVDDQVTKRSFALKDRDGAILASWMEEGTAVGSHAGGYVPPLTIEAVYDGCEAEVLTRDPAKNWITLTFHDDGVLDECTSFPKNCADDCAAGYRISTLELLD